MEDYKPFAEWIEATMLSHNLTQAEMARKIGVGDVQVSRWRRAMVQPSIRHLQTIADEFGVDRRKLEALAGYAADRPIGDDVDPALSAALDAQVARMRVALESVPRELWPSYLGAVESLAKAMQQTGQHVGLAAPGKLAGRRAA